MTPIFPPRPPIVAAVHGSADGFPIGRIFCVGRNYAAHAREMGGDERDPPFFFAKDADAYAPSGSVVAYPPATKDYQHEVELVVALGEGAKVWGYAVGLDMTRRDLQAAAKAKGQPWTTAKNFPGAAPMGPIHRVADVGDLGTAAIRLTVNGAVRQSARLDDMIWSVAEAIDYLSRFYRLQPGDLIMTGTPEGVGPVVPGDILVGSVDGLDDVRITVGDPA